MTYIITGISSKAIGPPTTCFNYMLTWYYLLRGRGLIGIQPTYCHQLYELSTNQITKHNINLKKCFNKSKRY